MRKYAILLITLLFLNSCSNKCEICKVIKNGETIEQYESCNDDGKKVSRSICEEMAKQQNCECVCEGGEETSSVKSASAANEEETEKASVPINFLHWYRENITSLNQSKIVNMGDGKNWDSTKFYSINFEYGEKYLDVLRSSNYVSEQYLDHLRQHFKECDKNYKEDPINDGPPPGFDYDILLNSQDTDGELDGAGKAKCTVENSKASSADVKVNFETGSCLVFSLVKEKDKWLISAINRK